MRKFSIVILCSFISFSVYSQEYIETLCKQNDFYFILVNSNNNFCGVLTNKNGFLELNSGVSYNRFDILDVKYNEENILLSILDASFLLRGIPCYRDYTEILFYNQTITLRQIEQRIKSINKNGNDFEELLFVFNRINYFSPALIICDNLRIREKPNTNSTTKVIGKLNKWDKVTVVDCTNTKDKIENLEYPWYKIKLEDGQEGWVFGGFTKIYFSDEDLNLLYKAFEKEGSEYTNQFLTPDNS